MLFFRLAQAFILKSVKQDLFIGKPKTNVLEMVSSYEKAQEFILEDDSSKIRLSGIKVSDDDETKKFIEIDWKDYGIGFQGRKKILAMMRPEWNNKPKKFTIYYNEDGSHTLYYSKKLCIGHSKKEVKLVDCQSAKFNVNFEILKDREDNKKALKNISTKIQNDKKRGFEYIETEKVYKK